MSSDNWSAYFIDMAMLVASKSKDPSTKVGCVIVGPDNEIRSTGYNGFPRGVKEVVQQVPEEHIPVEAQWNAVERDLSARCSCGAVINGIAYPPPEEIARLHMSAHDIQLQACYSNDHFYPSNNPPVTVLSDRWERPTKYDFVEHAERNAVYNAARVGVPLKGCRAYLNWAPTTTCTDCAKAIIQAGIIEVIGPSIPFPGSNDWKFDVSSVMLAEAGVTTTEIPYATE